MSDEGQDSIHVLSAPGVHGVRTREIALAIGKAMRLGPRDLFVLGESCMVHDIGKVIIPPSVLHKKGRLSEAEYEAMKGHAVAGERIIMLQAAIVRSHHERWDGGGYPDGLVGEEAPLLARILHAADAIDAMMTWRSYRNALTLEEIRHQLVTGSGTDFDPKVVAAIMRMVGLE